VAVSVVRYGFDLDMGAFVDAATTENWGDGLPFAPFDDAALAEGLRQLDADADALVGELQLTAAEMCAVALLAGCQPAVLPVVHAAVLAVGDHGRIAGRQELLDPEASRAVLVNGPARSRLGVNSGLGLMGPGFPTNATIGRALQLILRYCGMGHATQFGEPSQYALAFGEDEGDDWFPYHVERGCASDASTVSVFTYLKAGRVFDRTSLSADDCLERVALFLRDNASATDWFGARPLSMLVAVSHEWRRQFVDQGYSKDGLRAEIFGRSVDPGRPGRTPHISGEDRISIIGCGGPADASIWFFVGVEGEPVIREISNLKEQKT
jgi:hypothetical protein